MVRAGDVLHVFPRLCMHEGACLDGASARDGALQCPWHGRRVPPLAEFDLAHPAEQVRLTARHRPTLRGSTLTVEPLDRDREP